MIKTDVILGKGQTIVSDVSNVDEGWAGIVFSIYEAQPGEWVNAGAKSDDELGPRVRVISDKPESFDAVIAALERAKASLPQPPEEAE